MKIRQSKIEATIGTALFMALLFLLLWYVMIDATKQPEDEGIEIAFGDLDMGGGQPDGLSEANSAPESVAPMPVPSTPSPNELMTQEDEQMLTLQKQRDAEEKARQKAEAERLQREKAEAERLEAERIAREKRLAEQRAKEQAQTDKANQLMGALFGQSGSDEGANGDPGTSASSGTKGNPIGGHGTSGGNSWSLNGRNLKGSLPRPSNDFKQDGKVVVNIIVDASGKVVSAKVGSGTTVSDETTRQLAVKAAMKAEFDMVERPDKAFGTITYNFKFR